MNFLIISATTAYPCRSAGSLAAAAVRRGHRVVFVGAAHYRYLAGAGVDFRSYPAEIGARDGCCSTFDPSGPEYRAAAAEALFDATCGIARDTAPDLILCDVAAVHGPVVAESRGLPWASYSSSLFANSHERRYLLEQLTRPAKPGGWREPSRPSPQHMAAERRLNRLRERHRLPAAVNLDAVSGSLHLLFTTKPFEFGGLGLPASARCLGPVFRSPHHVDPDGPGGSALGDASARHGCILWPSSLADAAAGLEKIRTALSAAGICAIVETDLRFREDAVLRRAVSATRADRLRNANVAVCNGDFEFVQEALAWGVPLIVVAASPHACAVGLRVEELRLGRTIQLEWLNEKTLADALAAVHHDEELRRAVEEFAMGTRIVDGAARGVRYLENLAETGVAPESPLDHDASARLPERPRRANSARLSETASHITVIGSHAEQFAIEDANTARALQRLWGRLDGTKSVGDLVDEWEGDEDVIRLLDWLWRRNLVEEGGGDERLSAATLQRYAPQISLFSHAASGAASRPRLGGPMFQERLLNSKVAIVGAGALGSALIRDLAVVGIGELHLAAPDPIDAAVIDEGGWYRREDVGRARYDALEESIHAIRPETRVLPLKEGPQNLGGLDLVLVAQDAADFQQCRDVGRSCHAAGVTWTSLRRVRWHIEIGPTVIPEMTACFECFEQRREGAALSDPDRPREIAALDAGHFHLPLGVDLAAVEVVKLLTRFGDVASFGQVIVLSPMRMALETHKVLRLPNCPLCGARATTGERAVWRSSRRVE